MPFIAPVSRPYGSTVLASLPSNPPTLILSLNRLDIQAVLDQLTEVLWKYEKWEDNLSSRLHDWGLEVLLVDPNRVNVNDPAVQQKVEEKIIEIRKRILINPLNMEPLLSPVLEAETWEWEESFIWEYRQKNIPSPFSQKLIREYKSHDFAREMLGWLNTFFPQSVSPSDPSQQSSSLEGRVTIQSESNLPVALGSLPSQSSPLAYVPDFHVAQGMMQNYTSRYTLWAMRRELNQQVAINRQRFREAIALIEQRAVEAKKRAEEHERKLEDKLNQVEQTHAEAVHILQTNIEDVKEDLVKANQEKQVFQETCVQLGNEVQWLRNQVAYAQQHINALQSQNSGFCSIQ